MDEQQQCESKEGGSPVADQRQGNSYHWHYAYGHAYIYEYMHEYYGRDTVAVDSESIFLLSFGGGYDTYDDYEVQNEDGNASEESPFFPYRTEDEVCTLFWNKVELGLGPFEESLACKSSRTDCNPGLIDIVSGTHEIFGYPQKILYSVAVVWLEYIVEYEVYRRISVPERLRTTSRRSPSL